ncbi:MAG: xylulokinase [Christensenellales bacterium]|jgi:sugar (pentulose or hexulose) kinase
MNYLGLDIGTTGAKALLVDENGKVLGKGYAGYPLISNGDKIEQRADDWTDASASAIRQAISSHNASDIAAISLSTQGASTVAVDADLKPIGNAITWMDTRAKSEASTLSKRLGDAYIYNNTGWRINPALDAAKIMHMKRSKAYKKAKMYLSTLEYANMFLTGNPAIDPSNSSIRQLYNINKNDYDDSILAAAGISREELPKVSPTGELVGRITQRAAETTSLAVNTPVYNGAHDQYCASIGGRAVRTGDMLLSAGTTWVIMGIYDKPLYSDTYIAPGIHPVPGLYGAIASLVGSGASLQWFKNQFLSEDFDTINAQAEQRLKNASDLFFYPYLSGAYYPAWNINARGAFTGISFDHDKFDFALAIMEAAAFGVRRALDDFASNGYKVRALKIMGGASNSPLWCSIIAAAANLPVEVSSESDACALGAAIIAAKSHGSFNTFSDAIAGMATSTLHKTPDAGFAESLNKKYHRYLSMWEGLSKYYQ